MKHARKIVILALLSLLSACGGPPAHSPPPPYAGIKVGSPYQVYGRWYVPAYDEKYDEVGMASWYGPGFHGGRTANGERYDQNALTAAHRTLPLPCLVRVTNLRNGRVAVVRINDRGPFAHDRIIDLSRAAAQKLGIIGAGTAKVRVQFLARETRQYVDNLRHGVVTPETQYAMMEQAPAPEPATPVSASITSASLPPLQAQPVAYTVPHRSVFAVVDDAQAAEEPPAPPVTSAANTAPVAPIAVPEAATGSGHFFIQAGVFGVEENARRLLDKLAAYGSSHLKEVAGQGRTLYRVMVGPYESPQEARSVINRMAALGIPDAKIIHD